MFIFLTMLLAGTAAYLIGSLNFSIIVSRLLGKKDIRTLGSGNAGATNTLRNFGKGPAAIVFAGDILKAVTAITLVNAAGPFLYLIYGSETYPAFEQWYSVVRFVAGFFCVLGHNFPVYFGFKGGKGVATSIAVLFALDWPIALIVGIFSITIMAVTKYVSLGSVSGCVLYLLIILTLFVMGRVDIFYPIFSLLISGLCIFRHKQNLIRLLNGTESKLGTKKQKGNAK